MPINSKRPRLTLGMPIYNAATLLPTAIDSLLAQTFADFELIISDNASTDETESIARHYAAQDGRIRYVRHEINRGGPWNFNRVFELSDTEYFKWAAHDDVCHPTFVARCVEVLDQHPDVVWCHTVSRHIDVEGALLMGIDTPEISYLDWCGPPRDNSAKCTRGSVRPSDRFRAVLLGHGGCLDSYGVIRSAVLRKTPLVLPYFGSEKVLMAELGLWGRYEEVPETLFFARIHADAAGSQKSVKLQQQFVNPLARGRMQFARFRLLHGYLAAVRRSPVSFRERQSCYAAIARYLFQVHKWKGVVVKACTGAGMAGEYPGRRNANRSVRACS